MAKKIFEYAETEMKMVRINVITIANTILPVIPFIETLMLFFISL